jgi:hypothetical protein
MEIKPNSSIFDKIFNKIGLGGDKEQKPDGSKGKYFYVWTLNDKPGLYGQVGQTPGKSAFSGFGELTSPVFGALGSKDYSSQIAQGMSALSSIGKLFGGNKNLQSRNLGMGSIMGLMAEGGLIEGPGTGTSDSIIARVSAGEHIMPAEKTRTFLPLLEGIRLGRFALGGLVDLMRAAATPRFAYGGVVGDVQSIVIPSLLRGYAAGGMVADAGASEVKTAGGPGAMVVSLHPDAMNMTMRDWLEREAVRQHGMR